MKTLTRPLNIVSSSLAGIRADSHDTHILPAAREWVEAGRSISTLNVRLQRALHVHQATQRIDAAQSPQPDLPHMSPLQANSKGVRLTPAGASCCAMLSKRESARRFHRLAHYRGEPAADEHSGRFIIS